jgi:formylglycine-generating enzyme required for sulfatase activity
MWSLPSSLLIGATSICGPCQTGGPKSPAEQPAWLQGLKDEREAVLAKINYTGGVFDTSALAWTQRSYIQPQSHPYDRYFYDPVSHKYTIDRFLADLNERYGGIDSVLMWPTYTNIGIDDRNQYDFFRTMPGGLTGVAQATAELKAAGVRVLWPYNPWDTGTRREPTDDEHALAGLIKQTGGDGFNGDTMGFVPRSFWQASREKQYPLAFEPEGGGEDESLNWSTMGWGYWNYPHVPTVDRFKFLTRGKFMTHVCDRWAKRKTDNLQSAWFNGAGYESWENVWGTWNGIVPRDAAAIKRVAAMLRFWGGPGGLLQSPGWEPHTPDSTTPDVFASRFPNATHTLWTVVNRAGKAVRARLLVPPSTVEDGAGHQHQSHQYQHFFDCYRGVPLTPLAERRGGAWTVHIEMEMEAEGYGCALGVRGEPSAGLTAHLAAMKALTAAPLQSLDATWRYLNQTLVPILPSPRAAAAPPGMVSVPAAPCYPFSVKGIEIEGDDAHGVDVQFPWEEHPQRTHRANLSIPKFFIDKHPATNANYSAYLAATGYKPRDPANWLKHWKGAVRPPAALADLPVTYLSLVDARAYCAWRAGGARLPHTYEWQYAAQGTDGRPYPWGATKDAAHFPHGTTGNTYGGPEPVDTYSPAGDSPFGVSDLVGNVWQYTDEFQDEHTRAVLLRGGSNYRPSGSHWYFPNQIELNTHNKYFLFDDIYERAATIGVRCVKDAL